MSEIVSDINLVFSTPIWTSLIENHNLINKKMEEYIKSLQKIDLTGKNSPNFPDRVSTPDGLYPY